MAIKPITPKEKPYRKIEKFNALLNMVHRLLKRLTKVEEKMATKRGAYRRRDEPLPISSKHHPSKKGTMKKKAKATKVKKVMKEFGKGELHSGSKKGPEVTNRKQAIAIGLSEARIAGEKIPAKKKKK